MEVFWRWLLYGCLAWYALVTLYVAVRGGVDIRTMLRRLSDEHARRGAGSGDRRAPPSSL